MGKVSRRAGTKPPPNYKKINGHIVKPCLYVGKQVGHGNYMAGVCQNMLVRDKTGRPIPYKSI